MNAELSQSQPKEGTMNAVAKREDEPRAIQIAEPGTEAASLMAVISRAASDPSVDVDKLERLMGLYERVSDRGAKSAFTAALAAMQPRLPVITERGEIKHGDNAKVQSRYARFEDINDAVRPLLAEFGFALNFKVARADGAILVTGILSHRDGHSEETTLELPSDGSGSKNAVQAVGSSVSYGKRYTAIALLNITSRAPQDHDDDGVAGGRPPAVSAAISAVDLCHSTTELAAWKKNNEAAILKLPSAQADEIIRHVNLRLKRLRQEQDQ